MGRWLAITGTGLLLMLGTGCASNGMSEAECQLADWRAIGFEDGSRGAPASNMGAHRRACAEHGVAPRFEDYMAGHARGIGEFCRAENGARLGAQGWRYNGACPAELEDEFLDAYSVSFGLWERGAVVNDLSARITRCRTRMNQIEQLVVSKTAQMVAPLLTPPERVAIAVDIKQLAEEKISLEHEVYDLEHQRASAEAEYERYRDEITLSAAR